MNEFDDFNINPDNIPTGDDIERSFYDYYITRYELLKDFKRAKSVDPESEERLLEQITDMLMTGSKLTMLTRELFDLLLETEFLYRQANRLDDWNAALVSLINSVMTNKDGYAFDKADIDEELLNEMLSILYQRIGASYLVFGDASKARQMLNSAIDYGLDVASTEPNKQNLWLKAKVLFIEAQINILSLDKIEHECRQLMALNEQQPQPSLRIKGLIYLLMGLAHRRAGNRYQGFVYAQMVLGIGYAEQDHFLIAAAIIQAIEYAIVCYQSDLINNYILLWDYAERLRQKYEILPNRELEAHYRGVIAMAHFSRKNYQAAYKEYQRALELFRHIKDERNEVFVLHGQALVLSRMGEFKRAGQIYRYVAKKYRQMGIVMREVQVMYARVRTWASEHKYRAAHRGYALVETRLQQLPDNEAKQRMLQSIKQDLDSMRSQLNVM